MDTHYSPLAAVQTHGNPLAIHGQPMGHLPWVSQGYECWLMEYLLLAYG